jgi:peptidoglycan/xylan/chitin deacetylase (PgdA/CDA1 family)/glycosyltransferase involved in cell wall biosynthesis
MTITHGSVVIASSNKLDSLCHLVSTLIEQSRDGREVEIVVVLDGSADGSAEILASVDVPPGVRLRVEIRPESRGAAALNAGIAMASGEVILFLDDDMVPGPRLLETHLTAQSDTNTEAVIGRTLSVAAPSMPRIVATSMERVLDARHRKLSEAGASVTAADVDTANLSVKRHRLIEVRGFDESLAERGGQYIDLGHRLLAVGTAFTYSPAAVSTQNCWFTANEWRLRAWNEGRVKAHLSRVRALRGMCLEVDSLHDGRLRQRLAAQFAVQFPRLALIASTVPIRIMPLASRVQKPQEVTLQLAYLTWWLAFWSGVRTTLGSSRAVRIGQSHPVPILAYHQVCSQSDPALSTYAVAPGAFNRHMWLLRTLGYRTQTLRDVVDAFETSARIPSRTVVLTFDDGYRDTFEVAAPILARHGFRATVFAVTTCVGRTALWEETAGDEKPVLATWEQLQALREMGWEIGFHTMTHPDLTTLPPHRLAAEIISGKSDFERALGSQVDTIAYPYGKFTSSIVAAARSSGARAAVRAGGSDQITGTQASPCSPRFALPRHVILSSDSVVDVFFLLMDGRRAPPFIRRMLRFPRAIMQLSGRRREGQC